MIRLRPANAWRPDAVFVWHELDYLYGSQSPFVQCHRRPCDIAPVLRNGDRIFPPMLEAIRKAQRSINLESYIYWSGQVGQQFAEALAERARAGVKIYVLLERIGSRKIDSSVLALLEEAGVEVHRY